MVEVERKGAVCVFSSDSEQLAVCPADGEVKVWDAASGVLSCRFTPRGARGTAIAAVAWSRLYEHVSTLL